MEKISLAEIKIIGLTQIRNYITFCIVGPLLEWKPDRVDSYTILRIL